MQRDWHESCDPLLSRMLMRRIADRAWRHWAWPLIVLTALGASVVRQTAFAACPGDCDGDDAVSVTDVIAGVNIALGTADIETCHAADLNDDGTVSIDELIRLVRRALDGCAVPSIDDLHVDDSFDYATTHDVLIDITVATANHQPYRQIEVLVFAPVAADGAEPPLLYRGLTNVDGRYTAVVNLPTRYDALQIIVSAYGIPNAATVPLEGDAVIHAFGPGLDTPGDVI